MDLLTVTGMVLSASPIGDYDNRVVLLTRERGRISAFAKGAKRPKSQLAAVGPFAYGQFDLREGASSYTMYSARIEDYFEGLRSDVEGAYYGFYLLEFAQYFTRENNDEWSMLKLLYTAVRALEKGVCDRDLLRCIYEMRALTINGFAPQPKQLMLDKASEHTLRYAQEAPLKQLFAVSVSEEVLANFRRVNDQVMADVVDRPMKSLEMINVMRRDRNT